MLALLNNGNVIENDRVLLSYGISEPVLSLDAVSYRYCRSAVMNKDISRYILFWAEDNLYSGAGISDLVKKTGYSRRTLETGFSRDFGISPGEYLFRRRMSRAAVTLRLSQLSVTEVAMQLHYCSAANFTRAFHRYFGRTPDTYRREIFWDSNLLQSPLLYLIPAFSSSRVNLTSSVFITGERFQYQADYSDINDSSFTDHVRPRIERLHSLQTEGVWTALALQLPGSLAICRKGKVDVDAITGQRTLSKIASAAEMPIGHYTIFNFSGTWEEYTIFSRLAYMQYPKVNKWQWSGRSCFINIQAPEVVPGLLSCQIYIFTGSEIQPYGSIR